MSQTIAHLPYTHPKPSRTMALQKLAYFGLFLANNNQPIETSVDNNVDAISHFLLLLVGPHRLMESAAISLNKDPHAHLATVLSGQKRGWGFGRGEGYK